MTWDDVARYASPPAFALMGYVGKRLVSAVSAFRRELREDLEKMHKRLGKLETAMVDLEGAVHQQVNSEPPRGPFRRERGF